MRSRWVVWPLVLLAAILALASVAALPSQEQDTRPVQPPPKSYFAGTATVIGSPAPEGTLIVACLDSCNVYMTPPQLLDATGAFDIFVVSPSDPLLYGTDLTFHIVNQYGSIQADQVIPFIGGYALNRIDLTFSNPLPTQPLPTPTPAPTATPTPEPTLTPTPEPTATPEPTSTPVPTPVVIQEPTATPEPTPTAVPDPTATPEPTPTAILPVTGDTVIPRIPPLALAVGGILAVLGIALLYGANRRGLLRRA